MAKDVTQLLAEGLEHYLNGSLRDAATAWEAALRLDPANTRAREYLRHALSSHGPLRPGREFASGERTPAPTEAPPRLFATAWDDGPSASPSISLDEELQDNAAAHHAISVLDDAPPEDEEQSQLESLMHGARELYALNDFSGALELLDKVHELDPHRADAVRMREDCSETLTQMYESQIGPLDGVPQVSVNPDEIIWLNLDHRAGFVLAQIDGSVSYDDLYSICNMSRLDTARILAQLLVEKAIRKLR